MKDSMIFYKAWGDIILTLPEKDSVELMRMIFNYAFYETWESSGNPTLDALFNLMRDQLDRDNEKWDEMRRKRSEAGIKGNEARWGNRKLSQSDTTDRKLSHSDFCESQTVANVASIAVNVNDNVNVNVNKKESIEKKRFTPPSLQDVTDYINSKGYSVDPQAFIDFYDSKGWMIGKNKMKSWESAIGTWERRQKKDRKPNAFREYQQNTYDYDELEKRLVQN